MQIKKCFKCNKEKPLSEYYKHKQMLDGHLNKCKECAKKDTKENERSSSHVDNAYDKTEKGVIRVIYKTQRRHSILRKHSFPSYSKEELKTWMYEKNYKAIYDNWKKGGYKKEDKPSIDRIDDFKPYSLLNIRLGTWQDNFNHAMQDARNGTGTNGKRCKPVLQFNKNGKFMSRYVSYSSAKRTVGYSFEKPLKSGKPDRKNGFLWKYE